MHLVFTWIKIPPPPLFQDLIFLRELDKIHEYSAWKAYDASFPKLKETDLPLQKPIEESRGGGGGCITL